ncbi:MAG: D-alanyl-D-alanine carboxypeptidase family protein, partial [Solirubrobacteraceae bacterium]
LVLSHSSGAHHSDLARSTEPRHSHAYTPSRSPLGFVLGKPALALSGPTSTAAVQVSFAHAPRAGMLFNLDSGQVFWALSPYQRLPIASLTKMMSALLVVKSSTPDEPVLITKQAVEAAGSKVGVLPLGKHVPLQSLLYGLMLPSGNDAAIALAQHVAGSVKRFVGAMNREAAKLGLGCTRYSSSSGYVEKDNYSCAADLAQLAHIDIDQSRIASVVGTYSAVLPFPIKGGKLWLYNNNPLLVYKYPGATGMKTGQTEAAGKCLVATVERHGVRLGVVLLNSPELGRQAERLLNAGFEDIYHQAPVSDPPVPVGQ